MVTAGKKYNTRKFDHAIIKCSDRFHIEVVSRLIKHKYVTSHDHHTGEKYTNFFSSGSGAAAKLLSFLGLEDVSSAANAKKALNEKGLAEMIRGVFGAVKALFSRISRLVCHGEFRRFDLRIVVGDTDCADAAMNYGELCAAVYPLLAFLESRLKFRRRNVDLRCDFSAESTEAVFDGQLNYRPVYLLGFLLGLVGQYLKQDKKKGRT